MVARVSPGLALLDTSPVLNSVTIADAGTISFGSTGSITGSPTATLGAITATSLSTTGINASSAVNGLTAFAGGGQGSATPLTASINRVTTVASAADSVQLPAATAGKQIVVINAAAANAMAVFPQTGEIINALAANASFSMAANKTAIFSCAVAGTWNAVLTA